MPRKAKRGNSSGESVPAKRTQKETLTKDDIPSIVKAVLDAMQTHDSEPIGERQTSQNDAVSESVGSGGRRTTRRNTDSPATQPQNETRFRDSSTTIEVMDSDTSNALESRNDTKHTADQDIGKYNLCCTHPHNAVDLTYLPTY